ncbi:4-(cytidine 5'-diphospho)-2-C-methyl-D-erythritol kinase [Henriciella litoralis]|uniref:4-(cytidine 5'-diphospho)-2-C-methyl-D-erythritol kinase n=1 Tax=Henriciella litoralis TaxID=568102 RepID=UPI000A036AAA|nr:4-(cytidine 5'-diphospho)-2-C-methyl-D-erythritol kinase [Henriciella litoralis]
MLAPAKVNLFLHVGPVKENGRHDLDSLVMFAGPEASDRVEARKCDEMSLTLDGPFAGPELASPENLVLQAVSACQARGFRVPPLAIALYKNIPVAGGLGGGSADAGAMLRHLAKLGLLTDPVALSIASTLGGDVPSAFVSRARLMRGEGQRLDLPPSLPDLPTLLVNPRLPCPTGPVFQAFDRENTGAPLELVEMPTFETPPPMIDWLAGMTRNDLQSPATGLIPEIEGVLETISSLPGCGLARMSGSGASCFGLFKTRADLKAAADALSNSFPHWWIAPTLLKGI